MPPRNGTEAVPYIDEMEGVMEEIKLTDAQLTKALRCCTKDPGDLDGCRSCTLEKHWEDADGVKCYDRLVLQAAARLEELTEENRRLRDANEKTAEGLARRLADMAREGNTALERGLEGVNLAKLAEMTGIQSELEAFGRGSVIRAEPAGRQDGSMRIQEVVVEGRVVFSAEDTPPVGCADSPLWEGAEEDG